MKIIKPIFIILFLVSSAVASAQVIINEYSASNLDQFVDNYGKYEDWIELYNTTGNTVDIGGMHLSDRPSKPTKWVIPVGTTISPGGFLKFWCSGRNEVQSQDYHTSFKLTQTKGKDSVVLSSTAGIIINEFPLDITLLGHSRCRASNGSSTWKICTNPSPGSSNNGTQQYTSYAEPPTMSLLAGFYTGAQTVDITTTEPNASIYYTTDGNAPTSSSASFSGTLSISATTMVKAIVISNDPQVLPGKITTNTYFINESISLAVLSVGADEVLNLANGNQSLEPIGSIEYFNQAGTRVATSYGELNKHGQDSWALPHRSIDWVSRDEMGHSHAILAEMFHYSDRDEYQRVIMRASGDDNYPAVNNASHQGSCHIRDEYVHVLALEGGMKVDVRAVERIVVFLNGQYWGVYGLRERPVDHDYTKEYYDQGKYDIQFLATWGGTWAEYGGNQAFTDWGNLRDFILTNDMSNPINYQVAKDNIRLTSLIDYMIANLNSVASDWLNYNTGWWRGLDPNGDHKKWGYVLWDNDATFDYYINYSGVPNTNPDAEPCDINAISNYMDWFFGGPNVDVGRHEKIFLKLQNESPEFQQLYYSRQADLMNTVYTCDNMLNTLDSMVATIEPEMPRQINRWGGTFSEWWQNVATLRNFVEQRCTLLADGMINCFSLTGPYSLTLEVEPPDAGTIDLNTLELSSFPWTGNYFGNMDNLIKAIPAGANSFIRWETKSGNVISPDLDSADASILLTQDDTLVAVFSPMGNADFISSLPDTDMVSCMGISQPINFYSTSSNNPTNWLWEISPTNFSFINGTNEFSDTIEVKFSSLGTYSVQLIASNTFGADSIVKSIVIDSVGAGFALTNDTLFVGVPENVSNTGFGGNAWSWDFGDGVTSGLENPTHTYADTGHYQIAQYVENTATGCMDSMFEDVIVIQQPVIGIPETALDNIAVSPIPSDGVLNISYELGNAVNIEIDLYSLFGVKVAEFREAYGVQQAGKHDLQLNLKSKNLATGMYFLSFRADDHERPIKILLK